MNINEIAKHGLTALASIATTLGIVIATQPQGIPTGIVTIDASQAVLAFIKAGGEEMPDAEYEKVARIYQGELEAAIAGFAAKNGVIVVNSAAVLAGAPDITNRVAAEALQAFRAQNGNGQ